MSSRGSKAGEPRRPPARQGWLERHRKALREALLLLGGAPVSTLATVALVAVALMLPAAAWTAREAMAAMGARLTGEAELTIVFDPANDRDALQAFAEARLAPTVAPGFVQGWELRDREAVLAEYRAVAGVDIALDDFGDDNPVPLMLVVALDRDAVTPGALAGWADRLRELPGIAEVQARSQWLGRVLALAVVAERLGVLVGLALGAGVLLVVGLALRALLERRAAAVEVAKLCGATDAFVRRPFVYAGLVLGVAGGLLGAVMLALTLTALAGPLGELVSLVQSEWSLTSIAIPVYPALPGIGALLGAIGALVLVNGRIRQIAPV